MGKFFAKYVSLSALALLIIWALFGGNPSYGTAFGGRQIPPREDRDSLPDVDVSPEQDAEAAQRQLDRQAIEEDSILDRIDSAVLAPIKRDTVRRVPKKSFLEAPIDGHNQDSLVYEPGKKMVYIYEKGEITYQKMSLQADYMSVNMDTRIVHAYGRMDSLPATEKGPAKIAPTHPVFTDKGTVYEIDTVTYNLKTGKSKVKGLNTQQGEGFLQSGESKKMADNTINIAHGRYTTCNDQENPHFYINISRGVMTNKKIYVGPSNLVFEDVPIYFLGVPFAFFPIMTERSSGFIIPEYGEESYKGFFLRNGGYYFAFNDYIDATLTGGIYSLGSWELNGRSTYKKRYKYSGSFNGRYSRDIGGEKGSADYSKSSSFRVQWSHSQDPKFKPNTTFSASVDFSSSNYSKRGATTLAEHLTSQTNSSISYSTRWGQGKYSLSLSMRHSQDSRDTMMGLTMPEGSFSVSKFYPFRRKAENAIGKERWYEKISMSYNGNFTNSVSEKEYDMFTDKMWANMKNGVRHSIPVSMSMTLLGYINITPSFNYNETWAFKSIEKEWDPVKRQQVTADTTYGFYRAYNYSMSASMSTKLYGTYQFKSPKFPVQAFRHVMTPSVGFSFSPDFSDPKYGFSKPIQSDSTGTISYYSPMAGAYQVAIPRKSASMNFSLSNTLDMKVLNKSDTTGVKKIKLLEQLSASSSYDFLKDSLNLAPFSLNLRTGNLFGNFALQLGATLDPYQLNEKGQKINKFMVQKGKLGRITSTGWSFGYTFQSTKKAGGAMNDINNGGSLPPGADPMFFTDPSVDPALRRQAMTSQYYDFDIPWNFGFNYSVNYSKPGLIATVTQTMRFNMSVNLTAKTGVTFDAGYDFRMKKFTPGTVNITRDLHCWQMTFSWVPIGTYQQWSFYIGVKSGMLHDLKYDKHSSYYDNLYD